MPASTSWSSQDPAGSSDGRTTWRQSKPHTSTSDQPTGKIKASDGRDDDNLYDRSDWPLSNGDTMEAATSADQDIRQERGHHITKEAQSDWLDDEGVSDREQPGSEHEQQSAGAEIEYDHVSHMGAAVEEAEISSSSSSVSPNELTAPSAEQSPQHSARPGSRQNTSLNTQDGGRVSPIEAFAREPSFDETKSVSSAVSVLDDRSQEGEQSPPRRVRKSDKTSAVASRAIGLSDEANDEQLDSTPPLPSETFRQSSEHTRAATQSPHPRRPSDSPRHARHSSAAKAFSGFHSRQSSYNTTHVPSNRDRVRYSWQSVHEDESGRPRIHVIKLVSNTASASSAFPQGEAFGFSISPTGRRIAAYDSARLFILQTAALPVGISQDFSLKRRPLAVELNDSGSLVAILADAHTINVYDLSQSKLRRMKTLKLDFPTSCIAIAPCGGLLAAAYEAGIEVFSLAANALPTDRRAVRSPRMDRLEFSEDGSTLLGTTTRLHASSTVIVNVPIFPAAPNGIPTPEELKIAWCSELLHPENIRNSSHATFMREDRAVRNEHFFAWNGLADAFGILRAVDLEYGPIDFPLAVTPALSTCGGLGAAIHSCPAVDEFGDAVAMIVNDRTIRLYMVPQVSDDLDASIEAHSIDHELDEGYGCPFGEVRWVHSPTAMPTPIRSHAQPRGRLLVTSPGGVFSQEQIEESFEEVEGGRIILIDFDPQFVGQPGQTFILNLGKSTPQPLQEEEYDVDDAVALVRRRTVKQNNAEQARPISLGRAATTLASGARSQSRPTSTAAFSRRTASILTVGSSHTESSRSLPDLAEGAESGEAIEEPFSNQAPRSQASLQRAATNAQRHRFQSIEERNQEGTGNDNLPLPEYTEEPNAPLPSRFRAMAGLDRPMSSVITGTGHLNGPLASYGEPMSAPIENAENTAGDQALAAANASMISMYNQRNTPMPRGLIRAYTNANTHLSRQSHPTAMTATSGSNSGSSSNTPQFYDPFGPRGRSAANDTTSSIPPASNSMIARAYDNRFSTPLATISDYQASLPRRSSSTRRPGESAFGTSRNYGMQAFRQASATASLFPPTQSSDHLPLPANHRMQSAGTVAHPITNWRPPAPSTMSMPQSPGQGSRGHSRKSSLASKGAFASTAKAKKLGFFKKKNPGGRRMSIFAGNADDAMMNDSKSMTTWVPSSEKKCTVM